MVTYLACFTPGIVGTVNMELFEEDLEDRFVVHISKWKISSFPKVRSSAHEASFEANREFT